MFDIGWQELFIVAVLALLVIGPKDLPRALRTMGKWVRKARALARDFQGGLDDVMREADLDDVKNQMKSVSGLDIGKEIENTIDPTGEFSRGLDMSDIETDLGTAAGAGSDSTAAAEAEPEQAPTGKAAPRKAASGKAAPRKAASGKAAPRKAASGKAAPRKAASASKAAAAKAAPPEPEDEVITPAKASG
jgi:sec-independent protein translocase protein TatB